MSCLEDLIRHLDDEDSTASTHDNNCSFFTEKSMKNEEERIEEAKDSQNNMNCDYYISNTFKRRASKEGNERDIQNRKRKPNYSRDEDSVLLTEYMKYRKLLEDKQVSQEIKHDLWIKISESVDKVDDRCDRRPNEVKERTKNLFRDYRFHCAKIKAAKKRGDVSVKMPEKYRIFVEEFGDSHYMRNVENRNEKVLIPPKVTRSTSVNTPVISKPVQTNSSEQHEKIDTNQLDLVAIKKAYYTQQHRVSQLQEVYLKMQIRQKADEMGISDQELKAFGMPFYSNY